MEGIRNAGADFPDSAAVAAVDAVAACAVSQLSLALCCGARRALLGSQNSPGATEARKQ